MVSPSRPSINVSGFTSTGEVHRILMRLADTHQGRLEDRPLGVVVMVNDRTLSGRDSGVLFPPVGDIAAIFRQASDQGNRMTSRIAHYFTQYEGQLGEALKRIRDYGGMTMEGVNISCGWPPLEQLEATKPPFFRRVIMEIGPDELTAKGYMGTNDEVITEAVAAYHDRDLITDLMISPSHGASVGVNMDILSPLFRAITMRCPSLGIGVSGGFNPRAVEELTPLLSKFPFASIEAQNQLRTENFAHLDVPVVCDYVARALKVLEGIRHEEYLMRQAKERTAGSSEQTGQG